MAKAKRKSKPARDTRIAPTPEQQAHGSYVSAGMAFRRVPMIDTLLDTGRLSEADHRRLKHYRDQDDLAERSSVKSCLDIRIAGGRGDMPISSTILSAQMEVGRIERELGSLRGIARSVAIDDWSLSRWCCDRYGSRERYDGKGKFVAIVPLGEKKNMAIALMELRMAARRIIA